MTIAAIKPKEFPWYDYSRYTFSLGLDLGEWAVLSGHSASQYDPNQDRIVVKGGMREQARTAYEKIAAILDTGGYGFDDVARVVEYVTVAGVDRYSEAEEVRRETFTGPRPAVSTVVVNRLLRPEAWIEIEVTAGGKPSSPPRKEAPAPGYETARAADSMIFLSSILPLDENGQVEGEDAVDQTARIYENASKILAALGIGWDRIVKTVDYITPSALPSYKETGRVRREHLGPVYPAATGVIVERLIHKRAMIQIDFVASTEAPSVVNPGWERYGKLTYNPAVKAGNVLYLSGQAALDPESGKALFEGDVVAQTEYIYGNTLAVLRAAGLGAQHLVKTVEYVTPQGLDKYRETAAVRSRLLSDPFPASTGVVCDRLLRPEFLIEVDPMAVFD